MCDKAGRKAVVDQMRRWVVGTTLAAVAAVGFVGLAGRAGAAPPSSPPGPIGGHAMFTTASWGSSHVSEFGPLTGTPSVPTWSGSFKYAAKTYNYQMVGTNPAAGSATTTVPTEILPLKVVMANGVVLTSSAATVEASPIFTKAKFTSGTTQLADAMQRSSFWSTVSTKAPNYHLLLAKPTVRPTVTIKVPSADGQGYTYNGIKYGYILYSWWQSELQTVIGQQNFSARSLPIIVSGNTFLYNGSTTNCCVYGFHGSYGQNTYAFTNWLSSGLVSGGQSDVYTLSHEISEWAADPYVDNFTPTWNQPSGATCFSHLLEVGDPVEALSPPWYTIKIGTTTYRPSDIAGLSWFSRTSPSTGQNGGYSYNHYLSTSASYC